MKFTALFCILSFVNFGQISIPKSNEKLLSLSVLNFSALDKIPKFKKLEVGVQLPEKTAKMVNAYVNKEKISGNLKLNPFIEWELDVEAVFTHVNSKFTQRVEGFYYTDYKINTKTNDWDLVPTNFPMRLRFSPTNLGNWTCQVTLKVRGEIVNTSDVFEFYVVESDSKGFVSVHPNKKNLQRNGELIYPIGTNFCAPDDSVIAYHNSVTPELRPDQLNKAASPRAWKIYLDRIESYYQAGGKYIRNIQAPWANLIEFEEKGNYFNRLHYAWEQDKLIELSEKYDGLILFNFMMQSPFMNFGDYYFYDWDWDSYNIDQSWSKDSKYPVYCYNDRPGKKQPHEMFLIEEDLKYHEQRTRYYVARYGYSTSIYEFEILSEPYHLGQFWSEGEAPEPYLHPEHPLHAITVRAINNYQTRMSKYIKVELDHKNQLVGINSTSPLWTPTGPIVVDSSLFSPYVDVIGLNQYSSTPNRYIISKSEKKGNNGYDENENSYAHLIHDYFKRYNKPILIAEGGPIEHFLFCSNYSDNFIDNQTLQMTGFAGYNLWNGFRPHELHLWEANLQALKQSSELLIPVLSQGDGNYQQGRQKDFVNKTDDAAIKETQYYISSNKLMAVGYVRNLTENYYSNKLDDKCNDDYYKPEAASFRTKKNFKWDEGSKKNRLVIQGLVGKENYSVIWYNQGKEIKKMNFKTNRKGNWILEYPELIVTDKASALPVVWFSIQKTP